MSVSGAEVGEDRYAWVSKARCASADPEGLFVRGAAQKDAAKICRGCPVITECAADALDHRVEYGVWGGMTERQRRALLKVHPEVVSWAAFLAEQKRRAEAG
ncbi:WhiB family transcriptional regulator [Mycolicibacterium austroafricanum]|uniref:Transcriptional regulator WhiB n=1 Tax=Mycolicibacterium austroafricanum TaxID=39687 RepID=A0ABT8HCZ6_MYCAO|nr:MULTISPECIES: WhiB family transcriptional regulator [Mycolicibacterium]MDN4518584.1 WhiB family transcriptional regulator [Mycolicibacterium austroafricanum]QRZ08376.1 WhiB family transcriptional regulator [Mycolicibacterium austroafricanum]QZT70029.1 WhiB family transcriptional regulator [Mycolicibacterium austroafricanum]UJL31539.1 WhiB family transcriptional regulator [Mycolicibacterium vanbaalenii]WND58391.1 WhiB family transcriptional regulator [Mycolicibacterium vanbaalenii]